MSISRECRIIALCGIDGSGKTTLARRLREDPALQNAAAVKKTDKDDFDRLVRFNAPIEPMPDAYCKGPLAAAIRWAHAFDYLRHYETVVEPLLRSHALLISDRWSFCPIAFANIGTRLGGEISFLLRDVPVPDITIFLDTPPEAARERLERRGPVVDDEHIDLLRAYRQAYVELFQQLDAPVAWVSADSPEETHDRARRAVAETLGV